GLGRSCPDRDDPRRDLRELVLAPFLPRLPTTSARRCPGRAPQRRRAGCDRVAPLRDVILLGRSTRSPSLGLEVASRRGIVSAARELPAGWRAPWNMFDR